MKLRVLFQDEGRFGRISDRRRCWGLLPGAQQGLNKEEGGQEASHLHHQHDWIADLVARVEFHPGIKQGTPHDVRFEKGARSDFPVQGTILYSIFANGGQAYALQ
jgi:hypothetical protein